ncbi:MAG: tetratricopeptide repeat protein [Deltaproteobacteria bacterium]|nr:tetratricopeptide repeat protein [Deltaproteobacteria bacterium]
MPSPTISRGEPPRDAPSSWTHALLLVGLVALVFGKAVSFPFVDWDDRGYIVSNPLIVAPLSRGLRELLLTPGLGYPQPLTVLSQHLDFLLGGGSPWPFHLTNLLLHALNAVLVLRLLRVVGLSRLPALVGAALFAVHPIVAEPVCWATGRKDLLAAAFLLGALLVHRRVAERTEGAWRAVGIVLLLQLLSLGAKPLAVVLPLLFLAESWVFRRPLRRGASLLLLGGSVALSAASLWLSYRGQAGHGALGGHASSAASPLAFASQHLFLQVRNFVLPTELSPKYLLELPRPWLSAWGFAGLGTVLGGAAALLLARRLRADRALFGLLAGAILFAPSSGLVPLSRGPADSYLYLPGAMLALCVAAGVAALGRGRLRATYVVAAVAVAVLGFAGFVQAGIWSSSASLWRTVVEHYPQHRASHWAYADALAQGGRPREAVAVYERALRRFPYPPEDPGVLSAMGQGCLLAKDLPCALRWFAEAVRHYPDDVQRALRLVGVAALGARTQEGDASGTVARADRIVRAALEGLARVPEGGGDDAQRRLRRALTPMDAAAGLGLRRYLTDPRLAAQVRRLLPPGPRGRPSPRP